MEVYQNHKVGSYYVYVLNENKLLTPSIPVECLAFKLFMISTTETHLNRCLECSTASTKMLESVLGNFF